MSMRYVDQCKRRALLLDQRISTLEPLIAQRTVTCCDYAKTGRAPHDISPTKWLKSDLGRVNHCQRRRSAGHASCRIGDDHTVSGSIGVRDVDQTKRRASLL